MKKIRLGLIGAGWAARQHLEAIRSIEWMEAAAITSRTKAKAEALTKEFNIGACFDNIGSLVKTSKPDALMVLVSEDQVFNVTKEAIKYGLTLFIEKPAGLVPEENRLLLELADKNSIQTMVGFNRRYYSIFHKGLKLIKEKGPLLGVVIEGHERIWRIHEMNKFPQIILNNWIFANSVHTIDLLRFFGGEPLSIESIAHKYREPLGDQFAAIMELESGAIGQYQAHWYSPGGWKVALYGSGITVEFRPLEKGIWIDKNFNTFEIKPEEADVKFKAGFCGQLEAFGKLVLEGKKDWPMLDLEGSYKTMLLAEKLTKNVRDRTKIGIENI